MNIIELDSKGREGTGTQMADYPTVSLVSCQELIVQDRAGQ